MSRIVILSEAKNLSSLLANWPVSAILTKSVMSLRTERRMKMGENGAGREAEIAHISRAQEPVEKLIQVRPEERSVAIRKEEHA